MSTNSNVTVKSPDGRYVLTADRAKGFIKKVDGSIPVLQFTPPVTDIRNRIVCSRNSQFAAIGERGKFHRFSLNGTATQIGTVRLPINGTVLKASLSGDGRFLPVETNLNRLEVIDLEQGRLVLSEDIGGKGGMGGVRYFDFADNLLVVRFDSG